MVLTQAASQGIIGMFMSHRVRKYIAIFLLLWAAADLTVPGVCQTDYKFPSDLQATTPGSAGRIDQSSQGQANQDDDDCFCCCSHVIPGVSAILTVILMPHFLHLELPPQPPFISVTPRHQPPRS